MRECIEVAKQDGKMGVYDDGVGDGDGVGIGEQPGGGGEVQPWPTSGDAGSNHQSLMDALFSKMMQLHQHVYVDKLHGMLHCLCQTGCYNTAITC